MSEAQHTPTAPAAASAKEATPGPFLVSLTVGAVDTLSKLLAGTSWTKIPKEKLACGRLLGGKIADVLMTEPDPCVLPFNHPDFVKTKREVEKAVRAWKRSTVTLELNSLQKQGVTACIKHTANENGGTDEYFAELQEAFGITE
jgi:hypothetical protein